MLRACKQSSHKDSGMHEGGRPDCNWLQQGSWSMRVAWSNRMDEEGSIGTPGTAAQRGVVVDEHGTDACYAASVRTAAQRGVIVNEQGTNVCYAVGDTST
jgi:hypothetical protein